MSQFVLPSLTISSVNIAKQFRKKEVALFYNAHYFIDKGNYTFKLKWNRSSVLWETGRVCFSFVLVYVIPCEKLFEVCFSFSDWKSVENAVVFACTRIYWGVDKHLKPFDAFFWTLKITCIAHKKLPVVCANSMVTSPRNWIARHVKYLDVHSALCRQIALHSSKEHFV